MSANMNPKPFLSLHLHFTLCAAALSAPAAISTARAATATIGLAELAHLTASTTWTSARRSSFRLATQVVAAGSRCVAWLAGSSAGCRLPCYPKYHK